MDYNSDDGEPQLKIQKSYEVPPTDTDLMNMVITAAIHGKIGNEMKEHCEVCQVKSDAQFDHCHSGNCLDDETDHIGIYCEPAREKVKVNDLIKFFDKVRSMLGLKPIFAKQLAKSTLIWIPNEKIIDQIHDPLFELFLALGSQFDSESLKCGLIGVNFQHSAHEWRESFSTIAFSVPTMPESQIGFQDF